MGKRWYAEQEKGGKKWEKGRWEKNTKIFSSIKKINKEKKVTVFLVEQNAKKALELADRGYVLVNGNISLEGAGKDLLNNPDVQAAYLEGGK